jgi:hypothetical protein
MRPALSCVLSGNLAADYDRELCEACPPVSLVRADGTWAGPAESAECNDLRTARLLEYLDKLDQWSGTAWRLCKVAAP